ncbi:FAD:protein FMN transferase [Thermus sp.]|uniref:FAD:protein FMN transferase n=1 Tax=Thermus sp. TaxID=275 RepID=UPI00307EE7B1
MGRYGARWEGVLGSYLEVQLLAPPWAARRALKGIQEDIARLEGLFSRHRESELTRLLAAGGGPVSPEMRFLLEEALRLMEATQGAFHPAPRHGGVPYRLVGERVELFAPIDLDGLAKGHIADRAAARALALGAKAVLVNLGGDLARLGPGEALVALESPLGPDNAPAPHALRLGQGGVATSGVRHRGAHLLDPRTGRPAEGLQASVLAGSALLAEALAKALFVLKEEAWPILRAFGAQGVLFTREGPKAGP